MSHNIILCEIAMKYILSSFIYQMFDLCLDISNYYWFSLIPFLFRLKLSTSVIVDKKDNVLNYVSPIWNDIIINFSFITWTNDKLKLPTI